MFIHTLFSQFRKFFLAKLRLKKFQKISPAAHCAAGEIVLQNVDDFTSEIH
jgi:hypothetical protein